MIDKKNFNLIISFFEKNFFIKSKKKIKFVKKLIMYYKYKKKLFDIFSKIKPYWNIFVRFESLFGFLPKINSIKTRRKSKFKKIIFLRFTWVFKSFLNQEKKIVNVLSYIFDLNNYLYLKLILNKRKKIARFEEVFRHFLKKNIFIYKNSLLFNNNLYFRSLDFNRRFVNMKGVRLRKYKPKFGFYNDLKRIRFYHSKFLIESSYCKFFLSFLKVLFKNYNKLIIFLFKKYRKRKKKIEKTYILL